MHTHHLTSDTGNGRGLLKAAFSRPNFTRITLSLLFTFFITHIYCQAPAIQWQKCLGGSGSDYCYANQLTPDGGYIVAGVTYSNDGDVSGWHVGYISGYPTNDVWVVKLSGTGAIQWQKCLGGSGGESISSIQVTPDGGYILSGYTDSNDGDVSGWHVGYDIYNGLPKTDFWVVKLSSTGTIQWQKCLGGSKDEISSSIKITPDGGYIVAGATNSNDGDVSGNHGEYDIWVVKLTSTGAIQWQKCLGGSGYDGTDGTIYGHIFTQLTPDGGYILSEYTDSNDGDVSGNHGNGDIWVVKFTATGAIQWQKCLGGSRNDGIYNYDDGATYYNIFIQPTPDGGYIVSGLTASDDGDVSGWHVGYNYIGNPTSDIWVVKLSSTGTIEWQKCLGGSEIEVDHYLQLTPDGGYILSGVTVSNDGDVSGFHGAFDVWVVKLTATGAILWQKSLGGSQDDYVYGGVRLTPDGGYIVSGITNSNDGDVSGNHGSSDIWLVKLSGTGAIQWQKCLGGSGYDFGLVRVTPDGGYIVSGGTYSNDGDVSGWHPGNNPAYPLFDYWVVKLGFNPVPIKLTSITARNQGNVNIINWSSATEDPGERYELQRSADGTRFSAIASVPGNGRAAYYEYTDTDLIPGVNYYRLLLINNDGNNTFSKIVSAFVKNGIELRLSPNPASEILNIQIRGSVVNKATLQITDVTGKTVLLSNLVNNEPTKINISMLATGVYFLRYRDDQHEIVKKFVVN